MYSHALPNGSLIDVYRVERLLASGPVGLSYLATDTQFNSQVAVREFLPVSIATRNEHGRIVPFFAEDAATLAASVQRFVGEARTFGAIRHPHLVRVARLFEANGSAYLVAEYEPGLSLLEHLTAHGRPDAATITLWLANLADALSALHGAGVLHGGIQPARIRIRNDGTPVLLDFSVGQTIGTDQFRAELLIVSPGFTPLEYYWTDGPRGPWSDLYGLAAVGYWLITGERPVEAPGRVTGVAMTRLVDHPKRGKCPRSLLAALDAALVLDAGERPQNAAEWRQALGADIAAPAARFTAAPPMITPVPVVTATAWPPARERLESLQTELSNIIGPIASLVVKKAYARCTDWRTFCQQVANEIPDPRLHAAFLSRHADPELKGADAANAPAVSFPVEMLGALEAGLANYLGAIARVIIKRSAKQARSKSELYALLASEIADANRSREFIVWAESKFGRS